MTARILRVVALLLAAVVLAGHPAMASAAERSQQERRTGPLVMRYVGAEDAGGQAEFAWYASAVEQAYQDVQDVLAAALRETGTKPRDEIVVTLYGDDAAYGRANPVASREEGVLGHAQPSEGVIGVAVARLQGQVRGLPPRRDPPRAGPRRPRRSLDPEAADRLPGGDRPVPGARHRPASAVRGGRPARARGRAAPLVHRPQSPAPVPLERADRLPPELLDGRLPGRAVRLRPRHHAGDHRPRGEDAGRGGAPGVRALDGRA